MRPQVFTIHLRELLRKRVQQVDEIEASFFMLHIHMLCILANLIFFGEPWRLLPIGNFCKLITRRWNFFLRCLLCAFRVQISCFCWKFNVLLGKVLCRKNILQRYYTIKIFARSNSTKHLINVVCTYVLFCFWKQIKEHEIIKVGCYKNKCWIKID